MLPALLEDTTTELLELERLEGVEELDSLDELSIEEELDSLEELDSTEELTTSEALDSEELATSDELATSEALEDETAASLPGLVIMLDAVELLDEITELITLEAALLEDDFEDDFDESALDELAVETGESELPPPPQALSTTVSEKAVKALNVYKLMFSILYLCCVMPHTRERNYC